jgi:CheY-like chemotaxis protein
LLLADDSVTIQRVIELTFADENVDVIAVGDGKEAIDRIQSNPPDIVLADVGMPERSGYEVAEFIKGDPRFTHIPVLLLTGAFEPVDDVRARAIGCEGVLVKPFEPQMVISRVRELLKGSREHAVEASAFKAISAGPAEVKTASAAPPSETAAAPLAPDTLEDYFDRLDAALANLGAPSSQRSPDPVVIPVSSHEGSVLSTPAAGGHPRSDAWLGEGPAAPASMSGSTSLQSQPPAMPASVMTDLPSGPAPPLHAAFAALLAAERGEPVDVPLPIQEPLSEETLEEIANRVVAKMGDEKMRALVLDAAERLVREEIDRIKSQA